MKRVAKNRKETAQIAGMFLRNLLGKKKRAGALVVGLSGNLGAGKTAFVRATAKHLKIKETINSPTFVIIKKYSIKKPDTRNFLFHIDAYRLKNERELLALGWDEIIKDSNNLVFIEWPERVAAVIPKHAKRVFILPLKGNQRSIRLK